MPRLTNHLYQTRHQELTKLWQHSPELFRTLTPTEQQVLHRYYATDQQLTKRELIKYRCGLDKQHPALGQRAGKAYAVLRRAPVRTFERVLVPHGDHTQQEGPARVRAVLRPQPDVHKLAQAFVLLAERQRPQRLGLPANPDVQPQTGTHPED